MNLNYNDHCCVTGCHGNSLFKSILKRLYLKLDSRISYIGLMFLHEYLLVCEISVTRTLALNQICFLELFETMTYFMTVLYSTADVSQETQSLN